MNTLNLWNNVPELSVDEFMCLLFGLKPGTVKFDYGKPEEWPEGAVPVYRMLAADIQSKRLSVFYDYIDADPRYNGAYERFYVGTDNPWWESSLIPLQVASLLKQKMLAMLISIIN